MLRKKISLVLSLFLMASIVSGCGSTLFADDNVAPVQAKSEPVLPAEEKIIEPVTEVQTVETMKVSEAEKDKVILNILAEEGIALTEEGLKAAGIVINEKTGAFSAKAGSFSIKAVENFHMALRKLPKFPGKARNDYIKDLKERFPYFFTYVYDKSRCWVYYPKFRFCNEDGT